MKFNLDYFYGADKERYYFYRVPKSLFEDSRFNIITFEARMFYTFLLDRVSLSASNGWTDAGGRIYIFFTLEETMQRTGYGHNRATRIFKELENFGLIERRRQGLGHPAKIYVKNIGRSFDGKPVTPGTGKNAASAPDAAPVTPNTNADAPEVAETSGHDETASAYEAGTEPANGTEPESRELEPACSPARIDGEERTPAAIAVPAKVLDSITEPEQALEFIREAYEVMMSRASVRTLPDGGAGAETGRIPTLDTIVEDIENVENFSTSVEKSVETRPLDCGNPPVHSHWRQRNFRKADGRTARNRNAGLPEIGAYQEQKK